MITRRKVLAASVATIAAAGLTRAEDIILDVADMLPGDFTWTPERSPDGAVSIIVSLPEQRVHVYRNGIRIAVSTCSTGKAGHETPTGVFTVLQKDADHRSSTYGGAPMPNTNRLTWDGIALHAGNLPGYPASHGCVRLPLEFSRRLFQVTHMGTPVIIAGARSDAWELVHPGLVLASFDRSILGDAVERLESSKRPSDWASDRPYPVTSVLVTAGDGRILIMEDGREIAEGGLSVDGEGPLGEHVYVLEEPRGGSLRWVGITHHPDPTHPLWPEEQVLNRIRMDATVKSLLAERLHPGLTFIVSDLAATPDRRSGADFTIMTGEQLSSLEPPVRSRG